MCRQLPSAVLQRKVVSGWRSTGLESRTCFTAEGSTPSPSSGGSSPARDLLHGRGFDSFTFLCGA